jgi:ADP-ribose pyrophosphatase YjhB (NUDIX family)
VTARFCLACGARLGTVVEDGHRRRRCRRCGWTYYANPVPATAAIVIERGRLMLGRRARPPYEGAWDLPGGFLETSELPEPALRRELREELGVGIRRATLVGFANDRYGPGGFLVLTAVFRVDVASARVRPNDDVSELRWFPLTAIPYRQIAFPAIRTVLRRYLAGENSRSSSPFVRAGFAGAIGVRGEVSEGASQAPSEHEGGRSPLSGSRGRKRRAPAGSC